MTTHEQVFRQYLTGKVQRWSQLARTNEVRANRRAAAYIYDSGVNGLAEELKQDGQVAGQRICAFAQNSRAVSVTKVLGDVLGFATGDNYIGGAVAILLEAVKLACGTKVSKGWIFWALVLTFGVGAAWGIWKLVEPLFRNE